MAYRGNIDQRINDLAEKHGCKKHRSINGLLLGSGVPGSGKSTIAAQIATRINKTCASDQLPPSHLQPHHTPPLATVLPMDGFHYPRAHLLTMPNPTHALHRRGAPFTFNASAYHTLIKQLIASNIPTATIHAPSFDHSIGDPVEHAIQVSPGTRVVLVEGNYCGLNRGVWADAAGLMAEIWYVECLREVAWGRLARRHLESGIVAGEGEAWERARGTDERNAEEIRGGLVRVDEVVVTG